MKNCFHFCVGLFQGAVAADLFTKSVPGHFYFFSSYPGKPTKTFSLYVLATISMFYLFSHFHQEFKAKGSLFALDLIDWKSFLSFGAIYTKSR